MNLDNNYFVVNMAIHKSLMDWLDNYHRYGMSKEERLQQDKLDLEYFLASTIADRK